MSRLKLYDENMNEILLPGVNWLEFTPSPIDAERITEKVYNKEILLGRTTGARSINAKLWFTAADAKDFALLRNEVYKLLSPLKNMWAVDKKVPGVKWWVDVDSLSVPKRINSRTAECEVVFRSPTSYARSIGTSLSPFTVDAEIWGYGMGLILNGIELDEQKFVYTESNTTAFDIFNFGDVLVDPREHDLIIRLKSISAVGNDVRISNITTGEEWRYQGAVNTGDIITIDGVTSKRNVTNIVGNTAPKFGLLTLRPGNNVIAVEGLTGQWEVSFDFPFLYV